MWNPMKKFRIQKIQNESKGKYYGFGMTLLDDDGGAIQEVIIPKDLTTEETIDKLIMLINNFCEDGKKNYK